MFYIFIILISILKSEEFENCIILKIKLLLRDKKKTIAVFVFFLILICVYYFFDPLKYSFFLKCPLKTITGYECAGCGVQRAFHSLLHFRFLEAFKFNPLFVISIPFLLMLVFINFSKNPKLKVGVDRFIINKMFVFVVLIIVFVFSLLKNTDFYKDFITHL